MKKKFKTSGIVFLVLNVYLLLSFVSCGGNSGSGYGGGGGGTQEEQTQEGVFTATLSPENAAISSAVGSAEITIQGDEFISIVMINDALA